MVQSFLWLQPSNLLRRKYIHSLAWTSQQMEPSLCGSRFMFDSIVLQNHTPNTNEFRSRWTLTTHSKLLLTFQFLSNGRIRYRVIHNMRLARDRVLLFSLCGIVLPSVSHIIRCLSFCRTRTFDFLRMMALSGKIHFGCIEQLDCFRRDWSQDADCVHVCMCANVRSTNQRWQADNASNFQRIGRKNPRTVRGLLPVSGLGFLEMLCFRVGYLCQLSLWGRLDVSHGSHKQDMWVWFDVMMVELLG